MSAKRLEDDRELSAVIARAAKGRLDDLGQVVERFTPLLLMQAEYRVGTALRRFVDPADVVNDVWLVALRRLPEYQPEPGRTSAGLVHFLSTVLLRHVRDLYEKYVAGKPGTVAVGPPAGSETGAGLELSADATGVVTQTVRAEHHAALRAAITALDPIDRAVVVLRAIEDQPNQVVASLTGLTPNTVSVRLRRALEKLRGVMPASLADHLDDAAPDVKS